MFLEFEIWLIDCERVSRIPLKAMYRKAKEDIFPSLIKKHFH